MSRIAEAFSAGIAGRLNRETLAKEGPRVTRNELIDSLYDAFREARAEKEGWPTSPRWATSPAGINYDAADPLKMAQDINQFPDAARDSVMATLDNLLKTDQGTAEAKDFAQRILKAIIGPEYKGWAPKSK